MKKYLNICILSKRIKVARGLLNADLVLKDAMIPNLFTNEMINADVAIVDGYIAGIGDYSAYEIINCKNKYVCPAFVDGHVHLESTMALPGEFAKTVIPHGTLTVVADPHEIANVCGLKGIRYFIDDTEQLPMTIYFMAPSCVPATPHENNGATLTAQDLAELLTHPRVLGLGEVMDYTSVINTNENMLQKLRTFKSRKIDGHLSAVFGNEACAYVSAGILTNHECVTPQEVLEYLRLGMYIQVREGSAAKNLNMVLSTAQDRNICLDRLFFCTDDKHLEDIMCEGHILNNVRKAIDLGFSIYDVLRMSSLNSARCYGLDDIGAVAPGFRADVLIVTDISSFNIERVIFGGKTVCFKGSTPKVERRPESAEVRDTVHIAPISLKDLELRLTNGQANVISVIPEQLITKLETVKVRTKKGIFIPDKEFSKVAVIERHKATGKIGLGIVRGFAIERGAIASTISHDSHNIIVIGDNDNDMLTAVDALHKSAGGIYVVSSGKIIGGLPLPIAGLMSEMGAAEIASRIKELTETAYRCGVNQDIEPFGILSFLSLPVIPEVRITPEGLFNVFEERIIPV